MRLSKEKSRRLALQVLFEEDMRAIEEQPADRFKRSRHDTTVYLYAYAEFLFKVWLRAYNRDHAEGNNHE